MFPRQIARPRSTFLLFGPRGTGKSTWIRCTLVDALVDALVIDLLPPDHMLLYERDPAHSRAEVMAQPPARWIVLDEVQRVPKLLDQVHWLLEERGSKLFALIAERRRRRIRSAATRRLGWRAPGAPDPA